MLLGILGLSGTDFGCVFHLVVVNVEGFWQLDQSSAHTKCSINMCSKKMKEGENEYVNKYNLSIQQVITAHRF